MASQRAWMIIAIGAVLIVAVGIGVMVVQQNHFETVDRFVDRILATQLPHNQADVDGLDPLITESNWAAHQRVLIFKHGWAVVDYRTMHAEMSGADAIVMRTPDGRAWVSTFHACDGLPLHGMTQPQNSDAFLAVTDKELGFRPIPARN